MLVPIGSIARHLHHSQSAAQRAISALQSRRLLSRANLATIVPRNQPPRFRALLAITAHRIGRCPSGHFCPAQSQVPTPCDAGYFCPPKAKLPLQCSPGNHCPSLSRYEIPCQACYFCPAGASVEILCTNGSFCPARASSPTACPRGYFCAAGAAWPSTESAAAPTAKWTETPLPQLESTESTPPPPPPCPSSPSSGERDCPAGSNCPTPCLTLDCPAGHYCPPNTTHRTPRPCAAGHNCPPRSSEQQVCEAGPMCPHAHYLTASLPQCDRFGYFLILFTHYLPTTI